MKNRILLCPLFISSTTKSDPRKNLGTARVLRLQAALWVNLKFGQRYASEKRRTNLLIKLHDLAILSGSHGILAAFCAARMRPEERMVNESRRHPWVVPQAWVHRPFVSLAGNERLRLCWLGHPAPFAGGSCRSRWATPVPDAPVSDCLTNRRGLPLPPRHSGMSTRSPDGRALSPLSNCTACFFLRDITSFQ